MSCMVVVNVLINFFASINKLFVTCRASSAQLHGLIPSYCCCQCCLILTLTCGSTESLLFLLTNQGPVV